MKRNFKLILRYDGTRYKGWEHQPGTDMTIQGKVERVLSRFLGMDEEVEPPKVIAAGRTDAGVHARAMTANVHLDTGASPEEIQEYLNTYLPEDISVTDVRIASERFHARYNATGKTYVYTFYCGKDKPVFDRKYVTVLEKTPDILKMREAAACLTGTHDFRSFCNNPGKKKTTVRTVDTIDIRQKGSYITLTFHGDGFLRQMVRILTGTLLEVGYGNIRAEDIPSIIEAKERAASGPAAPPQGLCLLRVDY